MAEHKFFSEKDAAFPALTGELLDVCCEHFLMKLIVLYLEKRRYKRILHYHKHTIFTCIQIFCPTKYLKPGKILTMIAIISIYVMNIRDFLSQR